MEWEDKFDQELRMRMVDVFVEGGDMARLRCYDVGDGRSCKLW